MTDLRSRRAVSACVLASTAYSVVAVLITTMPRLPDEPSLAALDRWWIDVGTPVASMTVVHLVAIGLASWVAVASLVDLAARLHPTRLLLTARRVVCPPVLSRLLGGAVVLSAASPMAIAVADEAEAPGDIVLVDAGAIDDATDGSAVGSERVVLIDIGAVPGRDGAGSGRPLPLEDPDATTVAPSADTWPVRRGDHLWHIALETVIDRGGDASDAQVAAYWHRLIEANLDIVGDDPDLIIPGQIVRLPE